MDLQEFREFIHREPLPVVIEFCAPWCKPCQLMAPDLDEQAEKYCGRVLVRTINVEEHSELARGLNVKAVPTLILFRGGEEVLRRVGMQSPRALGRLFESLVGNETAEPSRMGGTQDTQPAAELGSLIRRLRLGSGVVLIVLGLWLGMWLVAAGGGLVLLWGAYDRLAPLGAWLRKGLRREKAAQHSAAEKSPSQPFS